MATNKNWRLKQVILTGKLLVKAYPTPGIFTRNIEGKYLPLSVHVKDKLLEEGFDKKTLKYGLSTHIFGLSHQIAIIHSSFRVNLDGTQAERIEHSDRKAARRHIREYFGNSNYAKNHLNKKGKKNARSTSTMDSGLPKT